MDYDAATLSEPLRTPLFAAHQALGARIIDFGGWQMPVQYKTGIIKEHKAVREHVGIFDVSHMGEVFLRGPDALAAAQLLVTNDVDTLTDGAALYTVMCYADGGIVDDCIVYRRAADEVFIVLNAANTTKDLAWIRDNVGRFGDRVEVDDQSDATALIAVQGPEAVAMLAGLTDFPLADVGRFHFADCLIADVPCTAARTGYTGEDGFELACRAEQATQLWDALLAAGATPIGLGARDTLRLEARLCLYGNDIDATTNPYEAGLAWVVKLGTDFIGKPALEAVKQAGVTRKLVGFTVEGRGIPRHGYPIVDRNRDGDPVIGQVTSGTTGIAVGKAIGMGYVPTEYAKIGNSLTVDCRGKDVVAKIVKGPFYKRS